MRKSIPVVENKVQLNVKAPKLRDNHEMHYILTVRDDDDNLINLLNYIRVQSRNGHSFTIVVDPGHPEYEKKFYIDGDGFDQIYDLIKHEYEGDVRS